MNPIGQVHDELLHDLNLLEEEGYDSDSSIESEFLVVDGEEEVSSSVFELFESASNSLLKTTRDASITITNASNLYKATESVTAPTEDVEEHIEVEVCENESKDNLEDAGEDSVGEKSESLHSSNEYFKSEPTFMDELLEKAANSSVHVQNVDPLLEDTKSNQLRSFETLQEVTEIESSPTHISDSTIVESDELSQIEKEFSEEKNVQAKRRTNIQRRRELLISQERVLQSTRSSAIFTLTPLVKRYVASFRKRRNDKISKRQKSILHFTKVRELLILQRSISKWAEMAFLSRRVSVICKWYRGCIARRKAKSILKTVARERSVEQMKSTVEKYRKRSIFLFWKRQVVCVKEMEKQQLARRVSSALCIQKGVRCHLSRIKLKKMKRENEYLNRTRSKVAFQIWRTHFLRVKVNRELFRRLQEKEAASSVIQKYFRGFRIRSRFLLALKKEAVCMKKDSEIDDILKDDSIDSLLNEILLEEDENNCDNEWRPQLPKIEAEVPTKPTGITHSSQIKDTVAKEDRLPPITSDHITSSAVNSEVPGGRQELMSEWKIKDKNVLANMMKRRDTMNKVKRRNARRKKLSNPVNRFNNFLKTRSKLK
ncbi:predicted protein [Chaetoceros tenuissimus]|uniref:Uncharacterized protein n=1 Tax=Chaetoceros tenuissimus TaxID=426638 RepID=A0AAD3HAN4_9STRA|nr:predicted protein [Chaetoceros tenuissimus]